MKSIEEINPIDYNFFYYAGKVGSIELHLMTSDGYMPIDNYDLIQSGDSIIIGYKSLNVGEHEHSYISQGKRRYIQLVTYQSLKNIISLKTYPFFKFYLFLNSIEMPSISEYNSKYKIVAQSKYMRCDYNKFGGLVFDSNQERNPIMISNMFNPISISGIGHIAYIETLDQENSNPNHQIMNVGSKTYAGILKTIYEWSVVQKEPFNNDSEIAHKASSFWNELDLPDDLKSWIINDYCDMRVARYLKGESVIPADVEGDEEMPEVLLKYILSNCKYSTLNCLVNNLNLSEVVSKNVLDQEILSINQDVYLQCLINNFDPTNFNIDELMSKSPSQSLVKYKEIL